MIKGKIDNYIDLIIKTGVFSLIVFSPLIIEGSFYSYKILFIQLTVSLLVFCYGIKFLLGKVKIPYSAFFIPIGFYLVTLIYSYLISPYPQLSIFPFFKNLIFVTFAFIFIFSFKQGFQNSLNRLIEVWIFTATVVAFYGILQFSGLDFLNIYYKDLRIFSTMGNPNFLAGYLVITFPICLSKIHSGPSKKNKIIFFICLLIILTAIFLAYSRGGYLALLFASLIYVILLAKVNQKFYKKIVDFKWHILISSCIIFFLIVGTIFSLPGLKKQVVQIVTRPTARVYMWLGAGKMILKNPLKGFGLGTFPVYFPKFRPPEVLQYHPPEFQYVKHAHNIFLEIWTESGILGIVAFLTLIAMIVIGVLRTIYKKPEFNFRSKFLISFFASFCGIMVMNLVNVTVYYAVGGLFFWLIIGVLILLIGSMTKESIFSTWRYITVPKKASYLISVFAIILSVILGGCSIHPFFTKMKAEKKEREKLFFFINERVEKDFRDLNKKVETDTANAEDYYKLGTIFAKRRDWGKALKYLKKAVELKTDYSKAYNNLGNVYFHKDKIKKAIKYYQKAVKNRPKYVDARYNLGIMYFKNENIKETVEEMKKILDINPKYYEARAIIDTIGE